MMNCWYTKSLKTEEPLGKIHVCDMYNDGGYDGELATLCEKIVDNPRWFFANYDLEEVTCLNCKKKAEPISK